VRATAVLRRSAFVPAGASSFLPVRAGVSASRRAVATRAQFSEDANLELSGFGEHVFKGAVAGRFLGKYGETAALLDTPAWTKDKSDIVAAALLDWARENGASVYCHWFQPMGSSGFRHGQSGQVYNTMVEFDSHGVPRWKVRPLPPQPRLRDRGSARDPNCLHAPLHCRAPRALGRLWACTAGGCLPAASACGLAGRGARCAGAAWLDRAPVPYLTHPGPCSSPARTC
jgi:hypothetical protein